VTTRVRRVRGTTNNNMTLEKALSESCDWARKIRYTVNAT